MEKNVHIKALLWAAVAMLLAAAGGVILVTPYITAPAKISSYCAGNQTRVFVSNRTSHFEVMWDESCS